MEPDTTDLLSLAEFYSADAETLRLKYSQIEALVGLGHHSPSEGDYCESLLKEFLRRTLPRHVSIDSGFIRRVSNTDWSKSSSSLPPDAPIATPQLDIIVHDSTDFAPLFRSEDLVVVLPEAVRAVIEVKKRMNWSRLDEAVKTIGRTRQLLRRWRHESYKVFTCIFAFSLDEDLAPKTKQYSDSFENRFRKTCEECDGICEAPDLLMALPRLALHQSAGRVARFDYCPTAPHDADTPNIAGQFLLFLLAHYTNWGTQGRALQYPEPLRSRREVAFEIGTAIGKS